MPHLPRPQCLLVAATSHTCHAYKRLAELSHRLFSLIVRMASDADRSHEEGQKLIGILVSLKNQLPDTIPVATSDGKIKTIISNLQLKLPSVTGTPPDETFWRNVNHAFDSLYRDDCRDSNGNLLNISSGPHGLGLVCGTLSILSVYPSTALPWELLNLKISCIIKAINDV
jgi:hypothetical protein